MQILISVQNDDDLAIGGILTDIRIQVLDEDVDQFVEDIEDYFIGGEASKSQPNLLISDAELL